MLDEQNKRILTEAGTNEVEILTFRCQDQPFGINVAKVREVIRLPGITKMPDAHHFLDGVFVLRGQTIPMVAVRRWLNYEDRAPQKTDSVIVTEFNQQWFGFRVDSVDRIHLLSWDDIRPAPTELTGGTKCITSVTQIGDELVLLLDFEKVANDIAPSAALTVGKVEDTGAADRQSKRLLMAEDSAMMRELLMRTLKNSGYTNLHMCGDGREAWEYLQEIASRVSSADEVSKFVDIVITDIEMPRMDGLHLISLIRQESVLEEIPIVVFSSLISEENRRKGEAVGANAQISKPEIGQLVRIVDDLV